MDSTALAMQWEEGWKRGYRVGMRSGAEGKVISGTVAGVFEMTGLAHTLETRSHTMWVPHVAQTVDQVASAEQNRENREMQPCINENDAWPPRDSCLLAIMRPKRAACS